MQLQFRKYASLVLQMPQALLYVALRQAVIFSTFTSYLNRTKWR